MGYHEQKWAEGPNFFRRKYVVFALLSCNPEHRIIWYPENIGSSEQFKKFVVLRSRKKQKPL